MSTAVNKTIGEFVKQWRERVNWSATRLATKANLNPDTIHSIETGKHGVKMSTWRKLHFTGCSIPVSLLNKSMRREAAEIAKRPPRRLECWDLTPGVGFCYHAHKCCNSKCPRRNGTPPTIYPIPAEVNIKYILPDNVELNEKGETNG